MYPAARYVLFSLVILLLAPTAEAAVGGSVWRVAVEEVRAPVAEATAWWQSLWRRLSAGAPRVARPEIGTTYIVRTSGYASSPYQTDATPCITAAGTRVRDGVVASNFLPLGTLLSVNDKLYIVEDRMNPRFQGRFLDIWFPSTSQALTHGRRTLEATIVGYGTPGQSLDKLDISAARRVSLRFVASARRLVFYLQAAVNPTVDRHDIDCFKDDPATTAHNR